VLVNRNRNKEKVVLIPTPDYLLVGEKWHFASRELWVKSQRTPAQHK